MLKVSPTQSRFWKGIVSTLPIVLQNSFCRVRDGSSNFWYDNWLGSQSLADAGFEVKEPQLKIKDILTADGTWNRNRLKELMGENQAYSIEHVNMKSRGGRDLYVWKPSKDGLFSTKSAWEVIRKKGMACAWKCWLWPNRVPKRISFVSWRA